MDDVFEVVPKGFTYDLRVIPPSIHRDQSRREVRIYLSNTTEFNLVNNFHLHASMLDC
jgi:hypothetical protein